MVGRRRRNRDFILERDVCHLTFLEAITYYTSTPREHMEWRSAQPEGKRNPPGIRG
jgi:hypothetical protein